MASLGALLRSCMESFKTNLTSQEFGAEYELLCTELSVQWLRVRLWGESIGLHFDQAGRLEEELSDRPDVESAVTSCVHSIAFLLSEIETIRCNYELRFPLEHIPDSGSSGSSGPSTEKSVPTSKSLLSAGKEAANSLRQRMRDNQKQKSFLSIAKWAMCDAKRFDEKVKRLKGLVDELEDVSRAATRTRTRIRTRIRTRSFTPPPPPYSSIPPPPPARRQEETPAIPSDRRISTARRERELPKHYEDLKQHAGQTTQNEESRRARTREKLLQLTNPQLYELRIDVYDELGRREQAKITAPFLPANAAYHPKRNQAREKMSTLPPHRFRDLTMDLVFELERRFPHLCLQATAHQIEPFSIPRDATPEVQRPPLSSRFSQSSTTLGKVSGPTYPFSHYQNQKHTPPAPSSSSNTNSNPTPASASVEIFKSFRVSMKDPCYKVLPAALKKYNINAPWEQYALYIVYGNHERCLGLEERPLILFKQLDKEGKSPMFMLRKIRPARQGEDVVQDGRPAGGVV